MPFGLATHPYAAFIHRVKRPAQYLGGELGETRKPWGSARARMCLAFPDLYEVGMSHLGLRILYARLNAEPDLLAERAYAPGRDLEAELRAAPQTLRSLESARALSEFDVVGFSLQFELTYTNVLAMLELGGIPLRSAARGEADPLVLCGGPVATHAEPLAPFADAFLIGDGEVQAAELLRAWVSGREAGLDRAARLRSLAALEGVYVPALYDLAQDAGTGLWVVGAAAVPEAPLPVRRAFVPDLDAHPFPTDGPVAATETVFDRFSVEIARGCTEGCRFCQAGMIYRPVRERSPSALLSAIEGSIEESGYDEASLTSLSTADYGAIAPLVREVAKIAERERVSLSVSSLRAYGLSEEILDELQKTRATGLTFAPEAGSQRMRDVVSKNVTDAQLMETAERVFRRGWQKMKLYFMIGLPTEEDEDVRAIVKTGARALEVGRAVQGKRGPRVTVSVSTHVPKPHTPFQWCAMDDHATVLRKQALLREEARKTGLTLRMHDSKGTWLEGVLARGDRVLGDVIEAAYRAGARFDSWEEELRLELWEQAFAAHGVDPTRYLAELPVGARLPWDHLDVGLEEGFLAKEHKKAMRSRASPPCGKPVGTSVHPTHAQAALAETKRLVCYECGVACDLDHMREARLVHLRSLGALGPTPPQEAEVVSPKERRRRVTADQGEWVRVRLRYARLGRMAMSSHLDLVRLLPRFLRRAGLRAFYTLGFHPKPAMTFGPSLPLGTSSLVEHVDLKLLALDLPSDDALLARLQAVAVDGLSFAAARRLGPSDPSLSRIVDETVHVAGIPRAALEALGLPSEAALAARIEASRALPLVVARPPKTSEGARGHRDGAGKRIDVGAHLIEVEVGAGAAELAQAGIAGDLVPLRLRLHLSQQGTARITEVLQVLLGAPTEAHVVRTGLFGTRDGRRAAPMELEVFRVAARSAPLEAASP